MNIEEAKAKQFNHQKKPLTNKDVGKLWNMTPTGRRSYHRVGKKQINPLAETNINQSPSFIAIHGCERCIWRSTYKCPHSEDYGGSVNMKKTHANKICGPKVQYIKDMREIANDGKENTKLREIQFKEMLDAHEIANYKVLQAFASEKEGDGDLAMARWEHAHKWMKMSMDSKFNKIKQDEGSKLTVKREVTPGDIASLIDKAKIIDAEVNDGD